MTFAFNLIIITIIFAIVAMAVYYVFKKDINDDEDDKQEELSIETLGNEINETLNNATNVNIADLGLNKTETLKREKQKIRLSKALRYCSFGDTGEKDYVKDCIEDLSQRFFKINEETINSIIKFTLEDMLSIQDKYEILFYTYKKSHGGNAFAQICDQINLEKEYEDGIYYEITEEDIDTLYKKHKTGLTYIDKLEIVAQRIYQNKRGLGVIDELRDQSCLDGISGGVSGINNIEYNYLEEIMDANKYKGIFRHDSVWVFYKGISIHLSFLSFGSRRELERVCKNIYRYDPAYYLSAIKGKIVAHDKRGNRITVARPQFGDSWKFFVRKFDSTKNYSIEEIIKGEGNEIVITSLKYLMKACMVIVITGSMGCGKTTLLKALVRFIDPKLNIGMEEDVFEAWLNILYNRRNINMYRKTDYISLEDGMDFQKKTERDVMIMGEVSEQAVASLLIQLSEFIRQTICTNHSVTTPKLIEYFRNALMAMNNFNNAAEAEEQVAKALNWDIHCVNDIYGNRYIERITEIIPKEDKDIPDNIGLEEATLLFYKKITRKRTYETRDIIVYKNGHYEVNALLSAGSLEKIRGILLDKDLKEFDKFYSENFLAKVQE